MDINIDLRCNRTRGTDMVPSTNIGMDVAMTPGDRKSHPYQYDPSSSMVHESNLHS